MLSSWLESGFHSWGTGLLLAAVFAVLASGILLLLLRPWLALLPFVMALDWLRKLFAVPANINKALAYFALEKDAAAYAHHTTAAAHLWSAGPEFRPAAREIFGRVIAGYGIVMAEAENPGTLQMVENPITPPLYRTEKQDPFDAARVAAAAEAMQPKAAQPKAQPKTAGPSIGKAGQP